MRPDNGSSFHPPESEAATSGQTRYCRLFSSGPAARIWIIRYSQLQHYSYSSLNMVLCSVSWNPISRSTANASTDAFFKKSVTFHMYRQFVLLKDLFWRASCTAKSHCATFCSTVESLTTTFTRRFQIAVGIPLGDFENYRKRERERVPDTFLLGIHSFEALVLSPFTLVLKSYSSTKYRYNTVFLSLFFLRYFIPEQN
jgi:hypothetical protein